MENKQWLISLIISSPLIEGAVHRNQLLLVFFSGVEIIKKNLPTHNAFKRDPKKKTDPPEMHQHFLRVVYFLIVSSFFFK